MHKRETGSYKCLNCKLLGKLFPTTYSLKVGNENDKKCEPRDEVYWCRILNGTRPVKSKELIDRVERFHNGTKDYLQHVLWQILAAPLATQEQLDAMIVQLHPYLNGLYYQADNSGMNIKYRRLYLSPRNYDDVNSLHALAFKLILMRQKKLTGNDAPWNHDLFSTSLLLLRLLSFKPLKYFADDILLAYYAFIDINENLKDTPGDIREISDLDNTNLIFNKLINNLSNTSSTKPSYLSSLQEYIHTNQALVKDAKEKLGLSNLHFDTLDCMILYWADSYATEWLNGDIDKRQMFCGNTTHHRFTLKHDIDYPKKVVIS